MSSSTSDYHRERIGTFSNDRDNKTPSQMSIEGLMSPDVKENQQ
jgi:hypothetical protein